MKKRVRFSGKALVMIFLAISACVDPEYDLSRISDEIEINPSVALPLMNCSMTVENILNELESAGNSGKFPSDSLAYISFGDSILSYTASDLLDIADQNILQLYIPSDVLANPVWLSSNTGDTVMFQKNLRSEFDTDHNEMIDSLKIRSGNLQLNISSTFRHKGILHIHSTNIRQNGQAFSMVIPISKSDGTFTLNTNTVLSNLMFVPDNSDPAKMVLPVSYELYLINSGSPVLAGQQMNISMTFSNIIFSSAFGYLGNYDLPLQAGNFEIGLYDKIKAGSITFSDPELSVLISNSSGVPVRVTLSNMSSYSEASGSTTNVTFSPGVNPFNIEIPSRIGDTKKDTVEFNSDNSNMVAVMATSPSRFNYNISARTNPAGITHNNFMTDTSKLELAIEFLLPLNLNAHNVIIRDTLDFDAGDKMGDMRDLMKYLRFTVNGTNGFPLEGRLQLILTDSAYNPVDSIFNISPCVFPAAPVDAMGKVTSSPGFVQGSEFNEARLDGLGDVKYLIARAVFNSTNQGTGAFVKFYSYNKLQFKLSMKSQLKINNREL